MRRDVKKQGQKNSGRREEARFAENEDEKENYLLPRGIKGGKKSTDLTTMLVVRLVTAVAVRDARMRVSHVYVERQMRSGVRRSAAVHRAKY